MRCLALITAIFIQTLLARSLTRAHETSEIQDLQGTWICVESFKKGERVNNFVGVRAVFERNRMTWIYPKADGKDRRQVCKFEIDVTQNPKHFDWYPIDRPDSRYLRLYRAC